MDTEATSFENSQVAVRLFSALRTGGAVENMAILDHVSFHTRVACIEPSAVGDDIASRQIHRQVSFFSKAHLIYVLYSTEKMPTHS